jgi:ABC-type uncharacterized transport system ATPase subunit
VVPRNEDLAVSALSGGNQQKLVIAREISMNPELLVAVQPTRGLDIRATDFVHEELLAQRAKGKGLLLVSLDIDELLAISDRIMVIYGGRVAGLLSRAEATEERLGLLMLGGAPAGSH